MLERFIQEECMTEVNIQLTRLCVTEREINKSIKNKQTRVRGGTIHAYINFINKTP